ncbi:MAG: DUF3298 domain-containing protein [Halomonas sp.]|nr:RsiV family protein [Halomonas sp.]MBP5979270.1 DUF3298 domain-containing protein [Halomonas sp.]
MSGWKISVFPIAALLLSGCQSAETDMSNTSPLVYQPLEKQYVSPECQGEHCSTVQISALTFPDAPTLTDELRARLLTLAIGITDGTETPAQDWDSYAQDFFVRADEDRNMLPQFMASEAQLEASIYAQHDDILVLELTSYVYHAGQAHGLPSTTFMVIDERQQSVVNLNDMLISGQQAAFQEALTQAHKRWLAELGYDDEYAKSWPLGENHNVAPLEDRWVVKYNVYEIAPYAAGQPELTIPVESLQNVAKPRYLGQ